MGPLHRAHIGLARTMALAIALYRWLLYGLYSPGRPYLLVLLIPTHPCRAAPALCPGSARQMGGGLADLPSTEALSVHCLAALIQGMSGRGGFDTPPG